MTQETAGHGERGSTLQAIAAAANVSTATASRVLNDRPGISLATRERVMRAAREHGYRRRGSEQDFAQQIEMVFGSLEGGWTIELIRGATRAASEQGLAVLVSDSGDRHSVRPGWGTSVSKRRPAGVILVASDLDAADAHELRSRGIPLVVVDPAADPPADAPSVGSTNWAGGFAATQHLIDLGHERIGVIAGPDDLMATRARVAGFRSAMTAAHLPIDEDLIVDEDLGEESSATGGVKLLRRPDRPTAVFATSDVKAFGVYEAARSLGLGVPADLSVVGYDDLQFARFAGPALTTVHQPLAEMAQEATRLLLAIRRGEDRSADRIELTTSLIVRQSTAPRQGRID
jgi:LacI family transcriptional regulator, xylobiose transport system transcriptional regulator